MEKDRLSILDGMRGWGALAVYLFHLGSSFFYKTKFAFVDNYFYKTPLQILFDGELAIFLFFILSGFSLSYRFFKNHGDVIYLQEAAQYRYFRLLIPVFFAILIPYFLIHFDLMFNKTTFVGAYDIPFQLNDIFRYTFLELPFKLRSDHGIYGPIFWTIYVEFTASLFIFAFLALFGTWNVRFLLYMVVIPPAYYCEGTLGLYFLFLLGMIICDFYCLWQRSVSRTALNEVALPNWSRKLIALVILLFLSFFYYYGIVLKHHLFLKNSRYTFALLLFLITLSIPEFSRFFSIKISKFLGRISFSLYLTHFPVLCSFSCFFFNFLNNCGFSLAFATVITCFFSTLLVMYVAYLFSIYIEESLLISLKISLRKIGKISFRRSATAAPYSP